MIPLKELRHAAIEDESKRAKAEVEVIKAHERKVKATPPKNVQRPRHATLSQSIQKGKVSKDTRICKGENAWSSIVKGESELSFLKMLRWKLKPSRHKRGKRTLCLLNMQE